MTGMTMQASCHVEDSPVLLHARSWRQL